MKVTLTYQKAAGSIERDENYVPYSRSHYKLPGEKYASRLDYKELFEETPLYSLVRLLVMQGW